VNVENLRKVRDHIASLPPEQVNMGLFQGEKSCGTVACIAGWATELNGGRRAQGWLGLYDRQTRELFTPRGWARDEHRRVEHTKLYPKSRVVTTLDHLIETGEVDWDAHKRVPA